ncbi:MAG: hypothetical protein RBT65_12575 [Methanolobus sp.]|nr:hypothetical protein [Methanolobus sp.]
MSIKSESIVTQLFLNMDDAIYRKDKESFLKAMQDSRLHNCVAGNQQYEQHFLSLCKKALVRFLG